MLNADGSTVNIEPTASSAWMGPRTEAPTVVHALGLFRLFNNFVISATSPTKAACIRTFIFRRINPIFLLDQGVAENSCPALDATSQWRHRPNRKSTPTGNVVLSKSFKVLVPTSGFHWSRRDPLLLAQHHRWTRNEVMDLVQKKISPLATYPIN